jgi:hypothetical protein
MKKFINGVFVILLAVTLLGVAASSASAASIFISGYTIDPWYTSIATGYLDNALPNLFQNSAQYVIYNSVNPQTYIISAHPNYETGSDDPFTAQTATFVTAIQRYNPAGVKEDCTVGGTFQIPRTYIRTTTGGDPYLMLSITFTKYNATTGAVMGTYSFDPVYFALLSISPPPAPTYEFK